MTDQPPGTSDCPSVPGGKSAPFVPIAGRPQSEYTDGRLLYDWRSHFPVDARKEINFEARILGLLLILMLILAGLSIGIVGTREYSFNLFAAEVHVSFRILAIFFAGGLGGTTFSIKWLIHSVAKGKWHLDRRYWRLLVPAIGGVYSCVVMTFFNAGLFNTQVNSQNGPLPITVALAFLVGYFSDGVSGLLSNVANAVFGTLEKK